MPQTKQKVYPSRTSLIGKKDKFGEPLLLEGNAAVDYAQMLKGAEPLTEIEKEIAFREGYSKVPYLDTKKIVTQGFGQVGPEAKKTFFEITSKAEDQAKKFVKNYDELPTDVQAILSGMAYNLGGAGLTKWTELKKALENKDYNAAADQLILSKRYDQIGNRAKDEVNVLLKYADPKLTVEKMQQRGYEMMPDPQQFAQTQPVTLEELLGMAGTGLENPLLARTDMFT